MASVNPHRYAGYRYDEETKLYYLMARYYNPDTGVFLSLDPVRGDMMNPITMNGYNYASNNPMMNVDPDGEAAIKFRDRLKYGIKMAFKKLLNSWGVSVNLGEKIVSSIVSFAIGSWTFARYSKSKVKNYSDYTKIAKQFSGSFAKTLINKAKQQLIRSLGKRAVSMMLGGVLGVALQVIVIFTYYTGYYAYRYKK